MLSSVIRSDKSNPAEKYNYDLCHLSGKSSRYASIDAVGGNVAERFIISEIYSKKFIPLWRQEHASE